MGCTSSPEEKNEKKALKKSKENIIENKNVENKNKEEIINENKIENNNIIESDNNINNKSENIIENKIDIKSDSKISVRKDIKIEIVDCGKKELEINNENNIDFKELFMDNLSPGILNLFQNNSKLFYSQSFLEGICLEYGLMGKSKNKNEAYKIYKDGADAKNDYLCMYRLHRIYLCDYKDFNIEKDKDLEQIYLYKCFAYLPYSIIKGNYFIFNKINISYIIAVYLDKEDPNLEYLNKYMEYLEENKTKYNLTTNDIKLMELVLKAHFKSEAYLTNVNNLKQFLNLDKGDAAYYEAQLKFCNFYLDYFKYKCDKDKIKTIFENLIKSKYYKASYDYGNFLINEGEGDKAKDIIKLGMENSKQFCISEYCYVILKEIEMSKLLSDYKVVTDFIKNLFLSISLEKLNYSSAIYSLFYLYKHSSFKNELQNDYINLLLEIITNIENNLKEISNSKNNFDEKYIIEIPMLLGQIYYYGIFNKIKTDKSKALEHFKKSYKLSKENEYDYYKRINYLYIYKCRKNLFKNKKIDEKKLLKTKNKLIKLYINSNYLNAFEIYNLYKIYKSNDNENEKSNDNIISLVKKGYDIKMIYSFRDYIYKEKCKNVLKNYLCNFCFKNKNEIFLEPCKHLLCQECFKQIKNNKCSICQTNFEKPENIK